MNKLIPVAYSDCAVYWDTHDKCFIAKISINSVIYKFEEVTK